MCRVGCVQERGECAKLAVPLDLRKLLPKSPNYFSYRGSKTEPDFLENVRWVVLEERVGVSGEAMAAMEQLSHGGAKDPRILHNARPTLPLLQGRTLLYWRKEES